MNRVQKKKNYSYIILLLVIVIAIICVVLYNRPINRLHRNLDLGQRYLENQDYEMAIVVFDKVIQIDDKCIPAYAGTINAYLAMGEKQDELLAVYEKTLPVLETLEESELHKNIDYAVDIYMAAAQVYPNNRVKVRGILEKGYAITGDERILHMLDDINAVKDVVSGGESNIQPITEIEELGYPTLVLDEKIQDAFQKIINDCLSDNYMDAVSILWSDDFYELARQCASQKGFSHELKQGIQEDNNSTCLFIKTVYENYHVYIDYSRMKTSELGRITFAFLPENGLGGMVSSFRHQIDCEMFGTGEEAESTRDDGFMLCDTINFNYNGDYVQHSVCNSKAVDPAADGLWTFELKRQENGHLTNNLYDGTIVTEDQYDSGTYRARKTIYKNGIRQPQITEDGSYEQLVYSNWTGEWEGSVIYNEMSNTEPCGKLQACDEYSHFTGQAPWE